LKQSHLILLPAAQFLKAFHGVVAASVIHENEPNLRFTEELPKISDGQTEGLVVARYDDHKARLTQAAMITDASRSPCLTLAVRKALPNHDREKLWNSGVGRRKRLPHFDVQGFTGWVGQALSPAN
jgi:hypothetical protein